MQFCDECGSIAVVREKGKGFEWYCKKCGQLLGPVENEHELALKTVVKEEEKEHIDVHERQVLPTTKINCESCDNQQAYWWMIQTRASDEPETRFFKCTKCATTWREYD